MGCKTIPEQTATATAVSSLLSSDEFPIVRQSTLNKVSYADLVNNLGVTGTLSSTTTPGAVQLLSSAVPNEYLFKSLAAGANVNVTTNGNGDAEISFIPDTPTEPNLPENVIVVNKLSDFPTQTATFITLEDNVAYQIGNNFDTEGKYFVSQGGTIYSSPRGNVAQLTYSGTETMFVVNQNKLALSNIVIDCPNGKVFEVTGDGTGNPNFRINIDSIICLNCVSIGDLVNAGAIILDIAQFANITGAYGIRFSGPGGLVFSLSRIGMFGLTAGAKGLDFNDCVTAEIEVDNFIAVGDSSAFAISGLASSGNISAGGRATISGGNFSSFTTPLENISINDIRWEFRDNIGLNNSQTAAETYTTTTTTVTINTAGVFEVINGGVWVPGISDRFKSDPDGIVTYNGERGLDARIIANATLDKVAGGTNELEMRIAINGVTQAKTRSFTQNPSPTTVTCVGLFNLSPNDTITLYVANNGSTDDVIVDHAIMTIAGSA